jgi:glucose/arabinose dehydrogenase
MHRRHQVLVGILFLEVVLICVLVAFALLRPDNGNKSANPTTTSTETPMRAPQVALTPFALGVEAPVDITNTGDPDDGRLFVVEQAGRIRSVTPNGQVEAQAFLDIVPKVQYSGEMGLLGLAFHPKYAQNGYFYVNYVDKGQNTIVARYTLDKTTGRADAGSEKVLIKLKQPFRNHNGGALEFGPDGYLYIALGDGGSGGDPQNNGQSRQTFLGKLLRIDVTKGDPYSVPASNPFVGQNGVLPEIWALGLRNPWRISFDRQTGDLSKKPAAKAVKTTAGVATKACMSMTTSALAAPHTPSQCLSTTTTTTAAL